MLARCQVGRARTRQSLVIESELVGESNVNTLCMGQVDEVNISREI